MPFYEYKVVAAPQKAPKVRGLKGPAKFAYALESVMNEMAQEGWEYLRAESLPFEDRKGLLSTATETVTNVLVFRRELYYEDATADAPAAAMAEVDDDADEVPPAKDTSDAWNAPAVAAQEPPGSDADGGDVPRFARRPLVADRKPDGS